MIPTPIFVDFRDGLLELRDAEVWRVARRYRSKIMPVHPARRIDRPTKFGSNRIVVRHKQTLYTATVRELLLEFRVTLCPVKQSTQPMRSETADG